MILIDNFYNENDWIAINKKIKNLEFIETHQPQSSRSIDNRLKGNPCYEAHDDELIVTLTKTLKEKTDLSISFVRSAIRKILAKELLQSPVGIEGSLHCDPNCEWAGVVYFDGVSIKGGTSLYFHHEQFEPDVIYAARPNRAILYKANTLHCANYDIAYKQRIIQTIFF